MTDDDLIQYLVREANRAGLKGMKIIEWIAPRNATDDPTGVFVYTTNLQSTTGGGHDRR